MKNQWSGQTFPHTQKRKPIIGDILAIDGRSPVVSMLDWSKNLGPIFEMKIFRTKMVIVSDPEIIAELCDETRFGKALPGPLEALRDFIGDGLFTAYNDEPNWQIAHDLLAPMFTKSAMMRYHNKMLETITELFQYWEQQEGTANVPEHMTKLTLETISRCAFSRDFGSFQQSDPHPFIPAMVAALRTAQRKGGIAAIPGFKIFNKLIDKQNAKHFIYVETLLDELIASRRADDTNDQTDLLGTMLHKRHDSTSKRLTDLNIRYQILTFLVAGHETTSGALSFAIHYLSQHPDCAAKARAEVDTILGEDRDAQPNFNQVAKFRYVRQVLDESMRLWPTVAGFARSPHQPTILAGKYQMNTDDWALILLPKIHRDPKIWGHDADSFDPDRFLSSNIRARSAHVYKPFGVGERACIGRQFALHEAVLVLARILHRYEFTNSSNYKLEIDERLTLMPKNLKIKFEVRQ